MSGGHRESILVVCTGNICRSPLGELLIQSELGKLQLNIDVSSAGTAAVLGAKPPAEIMRQATAWGLNAESHQPRQLDSSLIQASTLVLTASREHRAEATALVPNASRKIFTLKQFARISQYALMSGQADFNALEPSSLAAVVDELADLRALTPPPEGPSEDDVPDPFRRSQSDYDLAAREIHAAVQSFTELVRHVQQR